VAWERSGAGIQVLCVAGDGYLRAAELVGRPSARKGVWIQA